MDARKIWVLGLLLSAGCSAMIEPGGNGGWDAQRRGQELAERSSLAGTAFTVESTHAAPADSAIQAGPIRMSTALHLASQSNRRIQMARNEVDQEAARVAATRSLLLPSTTASGRYTWYTDPLRNRVTLPAEALPPGSGSVAITIRERDLGTLNGNLTLPLDLSGEFRAALRAAQAGYRGEQARAWATTLQEELGVVHAYFDLLEAQRLRVVTEQTIALDREQVAIAEAHFNSGRATKNDLLVAQVALRNAEQDLMRRDLAIAEARWRLNQMIGARVDAPTDVVDIQDRPTVPDIPSAMRDAYEHNPILKGLIEEQQRVAARLQSLERSRLPRLQAGIAGDYSTSTVTHPQQFGSAYTGFTWDLGTDLRRESQIAEARLALDRTKLTLEQQLRELEQAIRAVQQGVIERLSALRSAEMAVLQAEENLRIRRQQFDAGRAQSDDVLRAEAVLSEQRAILTTALYQAHTRRAELQQLMGLPLTQLIGEAE